MEQSFDISLDNLVIKDKKFRKSRRNKRIKLILIIFGVLVIIAVIIDYFLNVLINVAVDC